MNFITFFNEKDELNNKVKEIDKKEDDKEIEIVDQAKIEEKCNLEQESDEVEGFDASTLNIHDIPDSKIDINDINSVTKYAGAINRAVEIINSYIDKSSYRTIVPGARIKFQALKLFLNNEKYKGLFKSFIDECTDLLYGKSDPGFKGPKVHEVIDNTLMNSKVACDAIIKYYDTAFKFND
jgi:hypothetical protein